MPILNFESLEQLPEELRQYAKPIKDGESKVAVNVVPAVKIDEFRDNNIKLAKERDVLQQALEPLKNIVGDDVDGFQSQLQELRLTAQRVKDGDLKEGRQFEETLSKRTEELRKDYDTRLKQESSDKVAWKGKYADLEAQYQRARIEFAIRDACGDPDVGVEPRAVSDIVNAAMPIFKIENDGSVVPYEGSIPIYGGDGTSPMKAREWVKRLRDLKPFFFKSSHGGGAGGDGGGFNVPGKTYQGVPKEQLAKMKPSDKLALANAAEYARSQKK